MRVLFKKYQNLPLLHVFVWYLSSFHSFLYHRQQFVHSQVHIAARAAAAVASVQLCIIVAFEFLDSSSSFSSLFLVLLLRDHRVIHLNSFRTTSIYNLALHYNQCLHQPSNKIVLDVARPTPRGGEGWLLSDKKSLYLPEQNVLAIGVIVRMSE